MEYNDSELSLHVFNDEGLYGIRHSPDFVDILDELFLYTNAQLVELKCDLEEEE